MPEARQPLALEAQVTAFVGAFFQLPPGAVAMSSRLVYDLGADSSDLLELVIRLSEQFDCSLDVMRVASVVRVADLCAALHAALVGAPDRT